MSQTKTMKKVKVAHMSEISNGIGKAISVAGHEIALFKQKDNSIYAIQNRCPHKGAPLAEGIISGEYVFCPYHDWKIDVRDGKVQEPDNGCVTRYETEVENGEIYIYIQ
ncbi:nitrite reductase small subunit NirD [Anaerobacillus sp. MEB173]|uniref:nitrite reductase small subunit NirD n=1 Tax=Anaerobacillus sp. MEB173 TaxID=3383345 RepID=UPI003F90BDDE